MAELVQKLVTMFDGSVKGEGTVENGDRLQSRGQYLIMRINRDWWR